MLQTCARRCAALFRFCSPAERMAAYDAKACGGRHQLAKALSIDHGNLGAGR
ncbi:hypothetical protein PLA106_26292 [Pseudomonas amygdali pv. lachrymans str. M302278]|nr:hypothetical protein PLA106_26292 [Pseudomonas amygdali pv. lachrymans str. M302278]